MNNRICPECGQQVESEAITCPNCGAPLPKAPTNPSFSSGSLIGNENILCSAKWHWVNYLLFCFTGLCSLVSFILFLAMIDDSDGLSLPLFLPAFILFLIFTIVGIISIRHNEFVVTNQRIIIKSGIIMRSSYELRLEMLESIQIHQGILGRILGYGHILVHGIGASRQLVMRIDDPFSFRKQIFSSICISNNTKTL